MRRPRYPDVEVRVVAGAHPLVLIGATRQALRRAGVARAEIDAFSAAAFAAGDVAAVCRGWVRLVVLDADSYPLPLRRLRAANPPTTIA